MRVKNCNNCKHLEWVEAEMTDPSGFCCWKREYKNWKAEDAHNFQLDCEEYRAAPKKCCEFEMTKCPTCNGSGRVYAELPKKSANDPDTEPCKTCNGAGRIA